jgi:hypothetical protein
VLVKQSWNCNTGIRVIKGTVEGRAQIMVRICYMFLVTLF